MAKGKPVNAAHEGYGAEAPEIARHDHGGNVDDIPVTNGIPDYGGFYKLSHEQQKAVVDRLNGERDEADPSINPKVWDEKCWEASMIIASSLGEQVKTMWQEYSIWVHHEAVTLTELNYGERPIDNE